MPHFPHLEAAGAVPFAVKTARDLARADGLVLPGGESSAMLRLIAVYELEAPLRDALARSPAWGVCAGLILLARDVRSPAQRSFGAIPMAVARNGYGRQRESFEAEIGGYRVALIRAPVIEALAPEVETLAMLSGRPVWVRHGHHMATTFHPELSSPRPSPMHAAFVGLVRNPGRAARA